MDKKMKNEFEVLSKAIKVIEKVERLIKDIPGISLEELKRYLELEETVLSLALLNGMGRTIYKGRYGFFNMEDSLKGALNKNKKDYRREVNK